MPADKPQSRLSFVYTLERIMFRTLSRWSGTVLLTLCVAGVAFAQASPRTSSLLAAGARGPVAFTGTVTGVVTDSATGQPLPAAQVSVQVAGAATALLGASTTSAGRYTIPGVPAGDFVVRVRRVGYAPAESRVTVRDGQTATVNFTLGASTARLDQVVVTGTAGGTQMRAIGNVVEAVSASDLTAKVPVANVGQIIGGRTPGVIMLPASGQVGTGAQIRIRGVSSLSLTNDPILYIDGVRMDAEAARGPTQRGGGGAGRLNDINPEDIERIEIIKGPAAATLYGTEASNGVIQIITKRGNSGKVVWNVTAKAGYDWLQNPEGRSGLLWGKDASGQLINFNLYKHEIESGHPAIFSKGLMSGYNLNMRGGVGAFRYFNALSWDDNTGVVSWNWNKNMTGRSNLDLQVNDKLNIQTSAAYTRSRIRLAQGALNVDPFSNLMWGSPLTMNAAQRGFSTAPPEVQQRVEGRANNDRSTASIVSTYIPFTWLTNRLVAGFDLNSEDNSTLYPRDPLGTLSLFGSLGTGSRSVERALRNFITIDYSASARYKFRQAYEFKTSVGVQYYKREFTSISATGTNFPAIPITTVSGGSTVSGTEDYLANATLGLYVEQQLAWNNRLFLTGAVRGDDNSAFGKQFKAAYYPKLSAAWVISEEPFFKVKHVKELRLRAALGTAGTQPGTFDASRLYTPDVGYKDQPALNPSSFGNPALKPERSTELELGFEASLFNGKMDVNFSHYSRDIKDAIVNKPLPPSLGFPGSQVVNVGYVTTGGNELSVNYHAIERANFGWDIGGQVSTNKNEIKDLGGLTFINVGQGGQAQNRVGFSIADVFMYKVLSAKIDATGAVTEMICDGGTGRSGLEQGGAPTPCATAPRVLWGHSQPTWSLGFNTSVTLWKDLRLFAQVDGNGGNYMDDTEIRALHNLGLTKAVILRDDPFLQAYRSIEADAVGTYKAGFAKLREVSATYTIPKSLLARIGSSAGTVSLAGRNLMMLWTAQNGWSTSRDGMVTVPIANMHVWDAETRPVGQLSNGFQTILPPTTSMLLTLRLTY